VTRVLWWSNFLTSAVIGWLLAGAMRVVGVRWRTPVRAMVHGAAREHADAAARREGPYLAPVTFLGLIAGAVALAWWWQS
jgi:hypothetical protein